MTKKLRKAKLKRQRRDGSWRREGPGARRRQRIYSGRRRNHQALLQLMSPAITGESRTVIREGKAGDRSVTGGTFACFRIRSESALLQPWPGTLLIE